MATELEALLQDLRDAQDQQNLVLRSKDQARADAIPTEVARALAVRLQIERVLMARSAVHPEENAALLLLAGDGGLLGAVGQRAHPAGRGEGADAGGPELE